MGRKAPLINNLMPEYYYRVEVAHYFTVQTSHSVNKLKISLM